MRPDKANEGMRDYLKVPAASTSDAYSPPLSANGQADILKNGNSMENTRYSPPKFSDTRPSTIHSQLSATRSQQGGNTQRAAQPLPPEFGAYLRLQDETTILRVRLQEKRQSAARARKHLADCESKIEQALREASMAGRQIAWVQYQQLLEAAEQARNAVGPIEQEVEDLDFGLVSEEDRLLHDGMHLQDLMSQYSRGEISNREIDVFPEPPPSPPHYEQEGSQRASTEIFYEDDTSVFEGPIYDEDAPRALNLVDQYAPDLDAKTSTFHPEDPERPDHIELYVPETPDMRRNGTNIEEHMGPDLMERSSMSVLLQHYFKVYEQYFERWLLHFSHVRQSVQDMLQLQSLSALAVSQVLHIYNNIVHGPYGRTSSITNPSSGVIEDQPNDRPSKRWRHGAATV